MENKKIILPRLRYENAPEMDSNLNVNFEEEKALLRNDDRDVVLDLMEQFATERAACDRYKLYGKMKMVFRNLYAGISDYDYLKERLALVGDGSDGNFTGYLPYDEFAFLRNDLYYETTEAVSLSGLTGFTGFSIITSGSTLHQTITAIIAPQFNWNIYLSYVYDNDYDFPMKYTLTGSTSLPFLSGDGIPFRVSQTSYKYKFTSPVKHGISQGEYLVIDRKYYYINSVGDSTYRSEDYVINILKSQVSGATFGDIVIGKRCSDIKDKVNSTSQYYVHKHKTLTSVDEYILDKTGFESPIWEDEKKLLYENSAGVNDYLVIRNRMESVLFDYKEPFLLSGITNNLGYTPTELYTTVIFRNGNGYFKPYLKVGYSFHFHDSWVDEHFDDTNPITETGMTYTPFSISGFTFYSGNTIPEGTELYGAFVEYNLLEMKERIISEAFHKFAAEELIFDHGQISGSTYSGATATNPIGLIYQPHYRFKLRELSPYIEKSDQNAVIDNLPENAIYFPDEKVWRWRDLYDDGYIDPDGFGTDYPYLNDIHYIHKDINFYIRNEQVYTNKKDGIISFYKRGDTNICPE